jgi:hypothetical protein
MAATITQTESIALTDSGRVVGKPASFRSGELGKHAPVRLPGCLSPVVQSFGAVFVRMEKLLAPSR